MTSQFSASGVLRGRPLLTAVLYVMVGILPLYLTSAQILSLDEALGFGVARLGLATAVYFGSAAAASHLIGMIVQRVGATAGLRIGAGFALAASLVAATAQSWWFLLVTALLGGLANGFMQVSTNVVLAHDAAYHRQGVSFGAKQGAVPLGGALAGVLLPTIGVVVGWRWPYALAAVLAVACIAIAPEVINEPPVQKRGIAPTKSPLSRSLKLLAIGGACGGAAGNALALFVVPSAVDVGIGEAAAGVFLAGSAALVFLIRVWSGWFADRTRSSGHREMTVMLAVGSVACLALAVTSSAFSYTVAMALAMMGSWGWPGLVYFAVVRIHPEAPARASGLILAGNLTGTLLGPLGVGFLAERHRFSTAWTICAGLSVVAAAAMFASGRAFQTMQSSPGSASVAGSRI